MSPEQRMTESMYTALEALRKRKKLGRWPVTPGMTEERREKVAKERAERRAQIKAERMANGGDTAQQKRISRLRAKERMALEQQKTETIGSRIRKTRLERGMTQDQLAMKAGILRQSVIQYEEGTSRPRYGRMDRVAEALGVTGKWLREGKE